MRRLFLCASLWTLLLASCSVPAPVSVTSSPQGPEATSAPTLPPTAIPHAEALRFALVGQPTQVNAWALFDEAGASYANYAIHSDEYPRLYRLSVPAREFEPYIAEGLPSVVTQEDAFYAASVKLQTGLTWSDSSPLTAQDVAFTVNTALAFHLGLDWLSAYDPTLLDHAKAVDETTVKFFFKDSFNVGDWQYGALQGPIVSQAYWSPKLAEATALLPPSDVLTSLDKTRADADILQSRIDADNAQLLTTPPNTLESNQIKARITRNQNDLNSLNSRIVKLQDEYDAAYAAARAALYAVDDNGEPTFGPFLRAAKSGDVFTREANPTYPFGKPNYDRALYKVFKDEASALSAFAKDEADVTLDPNGVSSEKGTQANPTSSAHFLVFHHGHNESTDSALRRAIACMLDGHDMTAGKAESFLRFVLSGPLQNRELPYPCSGMSRDLKIQNAVMFLKEVGYTWAQEPSAEQAGSGMSLPGGKPLTPLTLLSLSAEFDPVLAGVASYIKDQADYLGISLSVQPTDPETLRYAVYSTGQYDMAILGWRLSEYPGFLCDWFQSQGPFAYNGSKLKSACEAFNSTADLETARQSAFEIQSILMEDLPFIPLYQGLEYDGLQNVTYPFDGVLNGLSGLYGAPALAIPSQ